MQRVGDDRLRVYLYHIPGVSGVPITHKLVERLMKAYPKQIAGMKDSSDDWAHTKSMIEAFGKDGFDVFSGNEKPLIENLKEEVRDVGDEAERATRETENSLELRTRDRYRKLINKIDSTDIGTLHPDIIRELWRHAKSFGVITNTACRTDNNDHEQQSTP